MLLLSAMALVVGAVGAVVAWALVHLIALFTNLAFFGRLSWTPLSPAVNTLGALVILIPVVGGAVIGLMARYGSEKIRGHGIPEALEAIIIGQSRIEARVAVLKPLSSAISIGTGGPFGAEGPIIMTGGAFGSLFAQFFHLTAPERKTLLVSGAAAGMAGIFATPVAAVMLAVELLLFEWKPRSFIPVAVASAVAAALRPALLGSGPLFPIPATPNLAWDGLLACLVVGALAGLGSGALTMFVYAWEDLFRRLPVHWMWWPAIGGVAVGIGGLIEPRALGVGYDVIGQLLTSRFTVTALVTLLVVKAVIWSIALGSGTSGGVLAPLLIIGGSLGALEAHLIPVGDSSLWVLVGMAAIMGGTMRTPFTAIVFALELTHDVNALLPLMVACVAAHAVTVLALPRSILTEKVARRGHHLTREYAVDPLEMLRVRDVMTTNTETLPSSMPIREAVAFFVGLDGHAVGGEHQHRGYPVVGGDGTILGVVTRGDALEWTVGTVPANARLEDLLTGPAEVAHPDEPLIRLAGRMRRSAIKRIPVVDLAHGHLVGIVSVSDILGARLQAAADETLRHRPVRLRFRSGPAVDDRQSAVP